MELGTGSAYCGYVFDSTDFRDYDPSIATSSGIGYFRASRGFASSSGCSAFVPISDYTRNSPCVDYDSTLTCPRGWGRVQRLWNYIYAASVGEHSILSEVTLFLPPRYCLLGGNNSIGPHRRQAMLFWELAPFTVIITSILIILSLIPMCTFIHLFPSDSSGIILRV